jgi:hypothetical protein
LGETEAAGESRVEAAAIVLDCQGGVTIPEKEAHFGISRARVAAHVDKGHLGCPQEEHFGVTGKGTGLAVHLEAGRKPEARANFLGDALHSPGEGCTLQGQRGERFHQSAGLGEAVACRPLSEVQLLRGGSGVAAPQGCPR